MSLSNLGLDAFEAIVEFGTVHGAAENICISQTGVTQRIRSLEKELNTSLFIRTKKGMRLTDDGETLLRYCHSKVKLEEVALNEIKGLGIEHSLNISISAPTYILKKYCFNHIQTVLKSFPQIVFDFKVDHSRNLVSQLKKGITDLVITPRQALSREFESKELACTNYYFVCSPQWQDRSIEDILETEMEVTFSKDDQFIELFLDKIGLGSVARRSDKVVINNEFLVSDLVSKGLGYMILDSAYARPLIESNRLFNPVPDFYYSIEWSLIWLSRVILPKSFSYVIQSIK